MKILIADDHGLFRLGLRAILEQKLDHLTILEADSTPQALTQLQRNKDIELALLDLNMPGNEGLSFVFTVLEQYPKVKVCVISANEDPAVVGALMDKGAKGYIPKSSATEVVTSAVQILLAGGQYFPAELISQQRLDKHISKLTPRQLDVLRAMAEGHANKQIAENLHISVGTVKTHITAIFDELSATNRTQAINAARQLGLII